MDRAWWGWGGDGAGLCYVMENLPGLCLWFLGGLRVLGASCVMSVFAIVGPLGSHLLWMELR